MDGRLSIGWVFSSLLLGLRLSPIFALAPPFTLTRVPPLFRALFGLALAACMVSTAPAGLVAVDPSAHGLIVGSIRELVLGLTFVLILHLMFAALYVAGRTLDIQAGFGLAGVINPATGEQDPLIGTLLVYAAGAIFLGLDGHADLLRIVRASLDAIPLGAGAFPRSLENLAAFVSVVFALAFGVAGGSILCLFLADLAIAMMARTAPQLNVLVLGLQIKTILILLVLPTSMGVAGALLARMSAATLEAMPRLINP